MALWQDVLALNPWLRQLGVTTDTLKRLAHTSSGTAELLSKIRELDVVQRRTQAMYREDGTRRFASEAELFQWEDQVRQVLRQAGADRRPDGTQIYQSPQSLIGFAEADLTPDEVRDRLQVWKGVKEAGDRAREIFYVYGGLNVSDDDLYEALVDPAAGQQLSLLVNHRIGMTMSGPGAWSGFMSRARQAGNARVRKIFERAQREGTTYATVIQQVLNVDEDFGNRLMDAIFTGGDPDAGDFLDLTSALDAYEFMAVGAAAEGANLRLPTLDRLKQIRAAGVERSRMIDAYQQFGLDRQRLNAAVQRARGERFTQHDFEQAAFLGVAGEQRKLEAGEAYMRAAGRSQGQFRFDIGQRGQFIQSGLSSR